MGWPPVTLDHTMVPPVNRCMTTPRTGWVAAASGTPSGPAAPLSDR
jgi:hypothetical protein